MVLAAWISMLPSQWPRYKAMLLCHLQWGAGHYRSLYLTLFGLPWPRADVLPWLKWSLHLWKMSGAQTRLEELIGLNSQLSTYCFWTGYSSQVIINISVDSSKVWRTPYLQISDLLHISHHARTAHLFSVRRFEGVLTLDRWYEYPFAGHGCQK